MHQKVDLLTMDFKAGAAIAKGLIVKFVTDDDTVTVGAANTDLLIGVAAEAIASGARGPIQLSGIAEVKTAGTITRGGMVTTDATGNGVALPASATIVSAIGMALASGVTGDIIPVLIAPQWSVTA